MRAPGSARSWALVAARGIAVYVAIDLALAFLQPSVDLLHDAESDYGNGSWSWLMDVNFLVRAGLSLAAVAALAAALPTTISAARPWLALLAVWAVASAVLAFFPDDLRGAAVTTHGKIHLFAAFVAFLCVAIGTLGLSRVLAGLAAWTRVRWLLAGLSVAAIVALLLVGQTRFRADALGGLWERAFLGLELAWLLVATLWIAAGSAAERGSAATPTAAPGR